MIRDAIESDLPCLAAAMVRLQEAHVRAFPDIYRRFDASDALSHLSVLLSRSDAMVRVAVDGDAVAGHVVLLIETRPESMFTHSRRYGHIAQIEVEPDFRRRGYGRLLLADCERLAASHDLRRIVLDVWAFNNSAKSFFQAIGYDDFGSKMSRSV
jgi:ribosomal protein S18 acetylase RimI-like enzyme